MELSELKFDEKLHRYTVGNMVIPSVTQIMQPLSVMKYGDIDKDALAAAANRGTKVHEACEMFGAYGISETDEETEPYFEGFMAWVNEYKPVFLATEKQIVHTKLYYAGTVDCIARIHDKTILVDYKTTVVLSECLASIQLEAYRRAVEDNGWSIDGKAILQLKKDGSYVFREFPADDKEAWKTFQALMTIRAHQIKYPD